MQATITTKVDWSVTVTLTSADLGIIADVLHDAAYKSGANTSFVTNLTRVRDEINEIHAAATNVAQNSTASKPLFMGKDNPDVIDALRDGKIVGAIKAYRAINPGMGLRDAKDAVESIRDDMYAAGTMLRPVTY